MKNIPLLDFYCHKNPDLKQSFRIMRISIFLLFFCLFGLMAENGRSQNARVTINRSNVQLESILNEIESQTDYLFIYKKDINVKILRSIQVSSEPVSAVLTNLLKNTSIGYKMEGNHIILTRDATSTTQQQEVTGIVVNYKTQLPKKVRKEIRKNMYYIQKYGLESHLNHIGLERKNYLEHLLGQVGYAVFINPKDQEMKRYKQILREYKQFYI